MKICFTSDENRGLESTMSYHFGHCPYFVIVDVEDNVVKNVETIPNPYAESHNPGDLPRFMKEKGVNVIITGGMGPRAQAFFEDYGITPVIGAYGRVKDVLEEYLHGEVRFAAVEEEHTHHEHNFESETGDLAEEVERMKKDIAALRKEIADLKSLLIEIKKMIS
jgi:predicted Fe-Mo cluster-binding NifX family protein